MAGLDPKLTVAQALAGAPALMKYAHDAVARVTSASLTTAAGANIDAFGFTTSRTKDETTFKVVMGQIRPDEERSWGKINSIDGGEGVRLGFVSAAHMAGLDPKLTAAQALAEAGELTRPSLPKGNWTWKVKGLGLPPGTTARLLDEVRGDRL
jgi:hypothetical protein